MEKETSTLPETANSIKPDVIKSVFGENSKNIIGYFKIGDRVQATSKEDGTQHGTVISMTEPKEPIGTEQKIWCEVEWDNTFTNAKISISLDSRIIEGMNGNDMLTFSPK